MLQIFQPIVTTHLLKELAPRVGGKPSAISINDGCDQAQSGGINIVDLAGMHWQLAPKTDSAILPEYGSCMATVDEDMSEGREAL